MANTKNMSKYIVICLAFIVMSAHDVLAQQPTDKEIISAVKFANSLESMLFANPDQVTSRKDVFDFYRRGYAKEIAENLTEYAWSDSAQSLKAGDRTMEVPEDIVIIEKSENTVVVAYRTPESIRVNWELAPYTIATLTKEKNRWVVQKAVTTDEMPVHPE